MSDILIGTPLSSCAVSMGSRNKPGNHGSAPVPRRGGAGGGGGVFNALWNGLRG